MRFNSSLFQQFQENQNCLKSLYLKSEKHKYYQQRLANYKIYISLANKGYQSEQAGSKNIT